MIVKIELEFKEKERITMLFGNSYKNWTQQFTEYCIRHKPIYILSAYSSPEKWISWAGLKWCDHESFQSELNRENCQRKYKDMIFKINKIVFNQAKEIIKRYN
jgi:hypothetical protein